MVKEKENFWTPTYPLNEKRIGRNWHILCKCKCGVEKYIERGNYLNNLSTKCQSCYHKEKIKSDIIGYRFGSYLVINRSSIRSKSGDYGYICKCDCGSIRDIRKIVLNSGRSKRCYDCRTKSITTHGKSRSGSYVVWHGMIRRCFNATFKDYKHYGARGITVCDRWFNFENFLSDMGERPKGLTIDRIDNNGNYEPSNCRWATMKVQANNKLRIRTIKVKTL